MIRLVRDYRSTDQVVELANQVLHAGGPAQGVRLVAQAGSGPAPLFTSAESESDEATRVAAWLGPSAGRHRHRWLAGSRL